MGLNKINICCSLGSVNKKSKWYQRIKPYILHFPNWSKVGNSIELLLKIKSFTLHPIQRKKPGCFFTLNYYFIWYVYYKVLTSNFFYFAFIYIVGIIKEPPVLDIPLKKNKKSKISNWISIKRMVNMVGLSCKT